jgi:RNA polymerase sigma-70 factor (ECF subfamily)
MTPTPAFPTAADEAVLVGRLLARDGQALRLLQERYARSLLVVLVRLVRNEALAQDLLQEGLLKIWLGIASYDETRGRLFTWMVRVCCNHAIDAMRGPRYQFHQRNKPLENSGAQRAQAAATFNPEHIGLRELTGGLKPKQREIIDLLYYGGCTQAEAAEELGIPVATVKTRVRAALAVLAALARREQSEPARA